MELGLKCMVESIKYLGHVLCCDLSDDDDIVRATRQLYCQGNVLLRAFHMCSEDVKLSLFRTYCYPVYTAHLWSLYRVKTMRTLKIAYHNIFKKFLGLFKYSSTSLACALFSVRSFGELNRRYVY